MEKINIAELLRDCPKGMELDCTMFENVTFEEVVTEIDCNGNEDIDIVLLTHYNDGMVDEIILTEFGTYTYDETAKCVIFPKGKTTWKEFHRPFKDGDVIYNKDINALAIFYKQTDASTISHCFLNVMGELRICHYHSKDLSDWKFATEEEKKKLFKVIKDNGYHWDDKTKTLEKLPKFKVGDRIRHKDTGIYCTLGEYSEGISAYRTSIGLSITYKDLKQWELAPGKFDISKLKPFDQVLVRTDNKHVWPIQFFERLNNVLKDKFVCMGGWRYHQCIPYEGNKHLLNTNNEPDKFYITWKE